MRSPFARFGGKFLVRGGPFHAVVGEGRQHNVVIEFPSHDAAIACYRSPEYQDAIQYLKTGCEVDLVIIGGYDGPQPDLNSLCGGGENERFSTRQASL